MWSQGCQMQTTQQKTSTKPDLSEEGPIKGKQYMRNGPHTSYISCTNQGTTIYVGHKWARGTQKWLPAWPGPCGSRHGQLCGPGNQPHSEEMHISSSSHITGECKGGSGWNRGSVSAPRGYYYTRGHCQGIQLCTDQAHRRRPG